MIVIFSYIVVFAVVGFAVVYGYRYQKKLNAMIQTFATSKGLSYQATAMADAVITEPDIFDARLTVTDILSDASGAMTFFCSATRGSGKNSVTISTLGHRLPVANQQATFTLVPSTSDMEFYRQHDLTPFKFESDDLNRIYRLLIMPGTEVNDLELLAPDVMLWLAQQAPNASIVGRPGCLYVFLDKNVSLNASADAPNSYESQYNIISAVADYLATKVPTPVAPVAPSPPPVPTPEPPQAPLPPPPTSPPTAG